MDDPDAERLLDHLASEGDELRVSANLDPQWNAATAEVKHRADLVLRLQDDAGLEGDVRTLLEHLADRGLVALAVDADGATVRLTAAGRERGGGEPRG